MPITRGEEYYPSAYPAVGVSVTGETREFILEISYSLGGVGHLKR